MDALPHGAICEECLPEVVNVRTGAVMTPEEFPPLAAVINMFETLNPFQKAAWHPGELPRERGPF